VRRSLNEAIGCPGLPNFDWFSFIVDGAIGGILVSGFTLGCGLLGQARPRYPVSKAPLERNAGQ
jgi:hypothetical protein